MDNDILNIEPSSGRLSSIDSLRGLVMVLMTLDHTRDFFSNAHFSPTNLDKTSAALFLTRWITHFCAPVFIFLAGVSACLWATRRGAGVPISGFLLQRGLLVLVLTLTVEAWAWDFTHDFKHINGGVLWAIAWSMMIMAGLVKLPLRWMVGLGGLLIVLHNALDWLKPEDLGSLSWLWAVLHTGTDINLADGWRLDPYYPLIPWVGVMAVGFGFGKWLEVNRVQRRRRLLALGFALMAAFILLRLSNVYGDPKPWQIYPDPVFTVLSFINCQKYPPSLLYLLMTLGPALVVLGLAEGWPFNRLGFLQVFGRTPLFFYLLHLYLIHGLALGVAAVANGPVNTLLGGGIWLAELPADYGYGLPAVYGLWVLVLGLLYPLCRGFEALKASRPDWRWLGYF